MKLAVVQQESHTFPHRDRLWQQTNEETSLIKIRQIKTTPPRSRFMKISTHTPPSSLLALLKLAMELACKLMRYNNNWFYASFPIQIQMSKFDIRDLFLFSVTQIISKIHQPNRREITLQFYFGSDQARCSLLTCTWTRDIHRSNTVLISFNEREFWGRYGREEPIRSAHGDRKHTQNKKKNRKHPALTKSTDWEQKYQLSNTLKSVFKRERKKEGTKHFPRKIYC